MIGWIKFGTKVDTKTFDKQIEEIEDKIEDLEDQKIKFTAENDLGNLQAVNVQLEKSKNKLIQLQKQQEQLNTSSQKSYKGISNGMEGVIKKVSKWALAIFGIRSAYMLVRRQVSQLTQYDDNLSSQLEYMSWTIAQAIAPVVRWIVNAVYLILQYVNQITSSLFGFKLFKGPDEFAKSMKSASGSAKEIQKALAGFDEKNVLGTNVSQGAGGGGATMPEFDPDSVLDGIKKVKKGIKSLVDNYKKEIKSMYDALDNPQAFTDAYGKWDWFMMGVTMMIAGLQDVVVGAYDFFVGIGKMLVAVFTGDWELLEEGFMQMMEGILEFFRGIIAIIVGLVVQVVGAIKGILIAIAEWIWNNVLSPIWEGIKKVTSWIWDKIKALGTKISLAFGLLVDIVTYPFKELKRIAKEVFDWIGEKLGPIINKVNGLKDKLSNINVGGAVAKVTSGASSGVKKIASWLGFANGGIINNPGRGVPLANAIGGEEGPEGIVPLSNTQAMEQLGETIGKYITINLTNVTDLDGNTIARKVSQIQNNSNFVRNR